MSERILVTGATGKVGREVVRVLLDEGITVMGATRSPDQAGEMLPAGTSVVEFDYDRADTYDAPVEWADRILVVPPPFDPHVYRTLASFLDWAVQAGTAHLVLLTAMGVDADEELPLRRVERLVAETGVGHTFLRPNVYMQNFHPGFIGRQIRDEGRFTLPVGGARVSLVDARDVAAVAARVLTDDRGRHDGAGYTLTGPEALDHHEIAAILSEAAGRPVGYEAGTDEAMAGRLRAAGWPDDQIEVVGRFFATIRAGARAAVTGDVASVLGRPARGFAAFAGEHAGAWSKA
ncbi:MAG: NmrA family NAD(P)-binding protein [Gemmatimonadota bacterium]|jgi:uncharacterized protein YbjT (DUF2867 family)